MNFPKDTKVTSLEDIFYWGDDDDYPTWCYRYEIEGMTHLSDDFSVLYFDTDEWTAFHYKQTGA